MKKTLRILCIVLAVISMLTSCIGCSKTVPGDMKDSERGTRADFTLDMFKSYNVEPTIDGTNIGVAVDTVGYEDLDYFNCSFKVKFNCLVLYEDMTEERITKEITVLLPYSGESSNVYEIQFSKSVHDIYEDECVIEVMNGEVIKK